MQQIILDIEWHRSDKNNTYPREILQIAAIKIDHNFHEVDTYYEIICPKELDTISENIYEFMHIKKEDLHKGKSFEIVARNFICWCGVDAVAIVLNAQSLHILDDECKRYNLKSPFTRSITIQELYINCFKLKEFIRFEDMCETLGIKIEKDKMHLSYNDVQNLLKVYKVLQQKIVQGVLKGYKYKHIYFVMPGKEIIHNQSCDEVKCQMENYYLISDRDAIRSNLHICKKCIVDKTEIIYNPVTQEVFNRIKKQRFYNQWNQVDMDRIKSMCESEQCNYEIFGKYFIIRTSISYWKFNPHKKVIKLFHAYIENDANQYIANYHYQRRTFPDPYQVIMYIAAHDPKRTYFSRSIPGIEVYDCS